MYDKRFLEFLEEQIIHNNTSQTSAKIRWEDFKAFIRGQIIRYTSRKTKEKKEKTKTLETKFVYLRKRVYKQAKILIIF